MYIFKEFSPAIAYARDLLRVAPLVHTNYWQGVDISKMPEAATYETLHYSMRVPMTYGFDLDAYRKDIAPNLPWADDHFEERVCGEAINPGVEWKNWPYGHSAARFLDDRGQFNHNYMERMWPKWAGMFNGPTKKAEDWCHPETGEHAAVLGEWAPHFGIRYQYGDALDVVKLLANDPLTRQAYLPIWFPEDTGGGAKRAPCTLGYHFIVRPDREGTPRLDVTYYIRSCDYTRHFRDDIYLTVRLALWMIEMARKGVNGCEPVAQKFWDSVQPGRFIMHITSLHMFRNDHIKEFQR